MELRRGVNERDHSVKDVTRCVLLHAAAPVWRWQNSGGSETLAAGSDYRDAAASAERATRTEARAECKQPHDHARFGTSYNCIKRCIL